MDDPGNGGDAPSTTGIAPLDVRPDAIAASDGGNPVDVSGGEELIFRVDTLPEQHVAFDLRFSPGPRGVTLAVDRWDGEAPTQIEITDAGAGIRVLAVLDQEGPRTFWVRVRSDDPVSGATLAVTRTPFSDGIACQEDCARLLQLPVPNDDQKDGYNIHSAIFRYQFGRRDLLMFIRHAGKTVIGQGMSPFRVADLSQWDGETPGTDRGAPRHASHERGKDVDISLYGDDGLAPFRSYCTTENNADGRECVPGSISGYDSYATAILLGSFYQSERIARCFLDAELIAATEIGADQVVADGLVASDLRPLYSDGVHLQHWPGHDNHVHVRVLEGSTVSPFAFEPFQAP